MKKVHIRKEDFVRSKSIRREHKLSKRERDELRLIALHPSLFERETSPTPRRFA